MDTTELTNVKVAELGKCSYLVEEKRPRLRAKCVVLRGEFCILAIVSFKSNDKKFSFRRVAS